MKKQTTLNYLQALSWWRGEQFSCRLDPGAPEKENYYYCHYHYHHLMNQSRSCRRKVWTRTKILSPNIRYFVATLRFVSILALFGRLWAKKVLLLVKNSVSWQEVHYYMVHIAYYAEINLQICNYARK